MEFCAAQCLYFTISSVFIVLSDLILKAEIVESSFSIVYRSIQILFLVHFNHMILFVGFFFHLSFENTSGYDVGKFSALSR